MKILSNLFLGRALGKELGTAIARDARLAKPPKKSPRTSAPACREVIKEVTEVYEMTPAEVDAFKHEISFWARWTIKKERRDGLL